MTETQYIVDSVGDEQKYLRICQIITALENQQIAAAGKSDISEYQLNDGQINIRTIYRSPDAIAKAINDYEKIKTRLEHKLSGTRVVTLRDAAAVRTNGLSRLLS